MWTELFKTVLIVVAPVVLVLLAVHAWKEEDGEDPY